MEVKRRTGRKTNIVYLLVDDMGWGDPGWYGGGIAVGGPTPNIDAVARDGLRLTSTYAQPTCTPTRFAMITSRLPVRTGLMRPITATEKFIRTPWADEVSTAKILSDVGYCKALVGKWHIGEAEGMLPHEVGFDEFYGVGAVESLYTAPLKDRANLVSEFVSDPDRVAVYYANGGIYDLIQARKGDGRNFQRVKPLRDAKLIGNLDQDVATYSIDFIRRAARRQAVLSRTLLQQSPLRQLSRRWLGREKSG